MSTFVELRVGTIYGPIDCLFYTPWSNYEGGRKYFPSRRNVDAVKAPPNYPFEGPPRAILTCKSLLAYYLSK